eukprot:gene4354-4934_t
MLILKELPCAKPVVYIQGSIHHQVQAHSVQTDCGTENDIIAGIQVFFGKTKELIDMTELDNVKFLWNTHHIRKSRHDTVGGIPDVLFFMPNATGHTDSKRELSEPEINNVTTQRKIEAEALPFLNEHDEELFQFFQYVVNEEQLCFLSKTSDEAKQVFSRIIEVC